MTPEPSGKPNSIGGEPQKRLACNRCHGQKLKCPRDEAGGDCARCVRAGATCIYSPPLPMGRPTLENGDGRKRRRETLATSTATEPATSIPRSSGSIHGSVAASSTLLPTTEVPSPQLTSTTNNDGPDREQQRSNGHSRIHQEAADLLSFGDFVRDWQSESSLDHGDREGLRTAGDARLDSGLGMDGSSAGGDPMALDGDGGLFLDYISSFANISRPAEYPTNMELGQAASDSSEFSRRLSPVDHASHGIFQSGPFSAHAHSVEGLRRGNSTVPQAHAKGDSQQGLSSQLLRTRGRLPKIGQRPSTSSTFTRPETVHGHAARPSQPRRNTVDSTSSAPSILTDPVEDCIQQLSEFNLTLYRRSKHRHELAAAFNEDRELRGAGPLMESHTAGADETFRASQTFIEILHRLIRKCKACKEEAANGTGSSYNSPSTDSHGVSSNSSPSTFRSASLYSPSDPGAVPPHVRKPRSGSPKQSRSPGYHRKLDSPTVFLVLTCYLRLLEEFFLLLGIIRVHLQRTIQEYGADGPENTQKDFTQANLPGLCFGSFSLSSSSQMQIVLLVQGIVHLLDRAKKAICLIAEPKERDLAGIARYMDTGSDDIGPADSSSDGSDCGGSSPSGTNLDGEIRSIAEVALLEVVNQQLHARLEVKSVKKLLQASSAF